MTGSLDTPTVDPVDEAGMAPSSDAEATPSPMDAMTEVVSNEIILIIGNTVIIFQAIDTPIDAATGWQQQYALVAASVSLVLTLVTIFMKLQDNKWLAYSHALWWIPAAAIFTQNGPFLSIGNGYLATWAVAMAALSNVRKHAGDSFASLEACLDDETTAKEQTLKHVVFLSSAVVFWAAMAAPSPASSTWQADYLAWAQVCSCISLVVGFLWHIPFVGKMVSMGDKPVCVILALMWMVGTFTMTFEYPFKTAGNGFFGAWVAGMSALMLGHYQFEEEINTLFFGAGGESDGAPATAVDGTVGTV